MTLASQSVFENQWAFGCDRNGLKKLCTEIVARFDSLVLEPSRKFAEELKRVTEANKKPSK